MAALNDGDCNSESRGILKIDFVAWENGRTRALLDFWMKVDNCCPQERVVCYDAGVRVNNEETLYANDARASL